MPGAQGHRFHALRHYFATLLVQGEASVKTVQLALGHATPTITLNTYVGRWPEAIEATRALFDAGPRSASAEVGRLGRTWPGQRPVSVSAGQRPGRERFSGSW
jgi:Phage integrase family